jgi:hypothetical protein
MGQVETVQIRHITGEMKGQDLALTFLQQFVATKKTGKDNTALGWPLPFNQQVRISINCNHLQRQREQRLQFFLRELGMAGEPAGKRVDFASFEVVSDGALQTIPGKNSLHGEKQ